ncbi:MAG: FAD/NAD(P)-binding protein [Phycisphaeraceae bacterium]|nr:FAD/NAD(P)-binding protein [Phycisphaeraceae bacterium]
MIAFCAHTGGVVDSDRPVVAIVGGGFSGAAIGMQLARRAERPISIVVFEPAARLGRGVAYGTPGTHLLLNVPAGKLGWDDEDTGGFHRWILATGRRADETSFVPREWYGEYVEHSLAAVMTAHREMVDVVHVRDRVTSLRQTGDACRVFSRSGGATWADAVVLAPGHGPTRCPEALVRCLGDDRVLSSPWNADRLATLAGCRRVLFVGTGLTMCDAAISLARIGFTGEMVAVSRHGLTPRTHGPSDPSVHEAWASGLRCRTASGLLRAIRSKADESDWRSVMDALRPQLPRLWGSLGEAEQRRFMHRLVTYWDVHRHRAPPETEAAIRMLCEQGRLRVIAGRIVRALRQRHAIEITLDRGASQAFEAVVLCTGPEPDPRRWRDPLLDSLISHGVVVPDEVGLGIRADETGFVVGRDGVPNGRISTLGPLRRGRLWESTAIPELRRQAAGLAAAIANRLTRTSGRVPHTTHEEITG